MYFSMISEERNNIEGFGDAYLSYMEKVPRMNVIAGIIRLQIRRRDFTQFNEDA